MGLMVVETPGLSRRALNSTQWHLLTQRRSCSSGIIQDEGDTLAAYERAFETWKGSKVT